MSGYSEGNMIILKDGSTRVWRECCWSGTEFGYFEKLADDEKVAKASENGDMPY